MNCPDRIERFTAGLKHHAANGVRPHILYGSKDAIEKGNPLILPPLQNTYFECFNPTTGFLSIVSDRVIIEKLVAELRPYIRFVEIGYVGERNWFDRMHGNGTITFDVGNLYVGEFKYGYMHGQGTFFFVNGTKYKGYNYNLKHGYGACSFSDGTCYEGEYKYDKKYGYGKYSYPNGDIYKGWWKDDMNHGQGNFFYAHSSKYVGEIKKDKRDGHDAYFWANGDRYEGEWKDDSVHGHGTYVCLSGVKFKGEMADDKFVQGQLLLPSLSSSPWLAVFADGDEIVNGFCMYEVTLKAGENGEIVGLQVQQWSVD